MAAPRVCSGCRTTRLSRFNSGSVCAPCERAAREATGTTAAGLWDSGPMRDALARMDPGGALAVFRAASRLSQQDVAHIMGWSQSTVSLIEKGQRDTLFDIRELLRFADLVDMPRRSLLRLMTGEPDAAAEEQGTDEVDEDVNRRSFGSLAAGIAAAVMLPEPAAPVRVTSAHVQYLRACADSLYGREQAGGGACVLQAALDQWRRARQMLEKGIYGEQTGRELMSAAGELAVRAGWASFDSADLHGLTRHLYTEALILADNAGDDQLAVHVLENMALQSIRLASDGRPGLAREAISLSGRAARLARHDPVPQLHALIAAREALAYAALGDTRGFTSAVSRAWQELEREPTTDCPLWLRFVGPAEIRTHEAKCLAYLGKPGPAAGLCRASLADPGLSPRNRAFYHAQLAGALAATGDSSEAVGEGRSALAMLETDVASPRALRELRPVRASAEQVGDKEFCQRFDQAVHVAMA